MLEIILIPQCRIANLRSAVTWSVARSSPSGDLRSSVGRGVRDGEVTGLLSLPFSTSADSLSNILTRALPCVVSVFWKAS